MGMFSILRGPSSLASGVDAAAQEERRRSPTPAASEGGAGGEGADVGALLDRSEPQGAVQNAAADPMEALRSDEFVLRAVRALAGSPDGGSDRAQVPLPITLPDAPLNELIEEAAQQRSRRSATRDENDPLNKTVPNNLIPVGVGGPPSTLTRFNEWFRTTVLDQEVKERNTDIAGAYQGVEVRVHTGGTDWAKLNLSVQTATQAVLRVAGAAYSQHGPAVAEAFIMKLFDGKQYSALPEHIRVVIDREWVRIHNLAAVLHTVSRQGQPTDPQVTVSLNAARQSFTNALREEDLRRAMFKPDSQPNQSAGGAIYFDGNALANAAGKRFDDLVQDPSLNRLPRYMALTPARKSATVKQWLDERGLDSQYRFGTVENAMASVLKAAALARGDTLPGDYATPADLCRAFLALAHNWRHDKGSLIDPRILLGLNLAKTRGVVLAGNNVTERLADLRNFVNDALAEFDGPPRFDKRSAALQSLERESGLNEAALTTRLQGTGKSVLDAFLEQSAQSPNPDAFLTAANGTRISVLEVADQVDLEESMFLARDHREAPYYKALARLQLRNEHIALTDVAMLDARTAEFAENDRSAQTDAQAGGVRHWLDNTPIVGSAIGFTEGVYTGNVEEVVNSIPVVSNFYNFEEGLRKGDYHRAGMAIVTLIPYVGAIATIVDGARQGDTAEVVGGLEGLALDFFTLGEGHLLTTGKSFRTVVARTAADEAKGSAGAARIVPHETFPTSLQVHVNQSLTALRDLGVGEGGAAENGLALRIAPERAARKPVQKRAEPVAVMPAPEDVRAMSQLDHYAISPRPSKLQPGKDGMLWDPASAANYAEFGGKLYRVRMDRSKSAPQRVIWNVASADGSYAKATIRLEYVVDKAKGEGRWQIAKNLPGLKGGAREGEIEPGAFLDDYYERGLDEARIKAKGPLLNELLTTKGEALVAAIEKANEEMALKLNGDVQTLRADWEKMKKSESDFLNSKGLNSDQRAKLKSTFSVAQRGFLDGLPKLAKYVNELAIHVTEIRRAVTEVVDSVDTKQKANGVVMRVMSEEEALDIKNSNELRQAKESFEQHKWFYTDRSKPPVQNKTTPYRFEMDVPKEMTDKIFSVASDDKDATYAPFRHKPGGTRENSTAWDTGEPGAFGVQRHGLEEFSQLLNKCKWRIVRLSDDTVIASGPAAGGGSGARGGSAASGGAGASGGSRVGGRSAA